MGQGRKKEKKQIANVDNGDDPATCPLFPGFMPSRLAVISNWTTRATTRALLVFSLHMGRIVVPPYLPLTRLYKRQKMLSTPRACAVAPQFGNGR